MSASARFARDMYNVALGFFDPSWAVAVISRNHHIQAMNARALDLWEIPEGTPKEKYIGQQIHNVLVPQHFAGTHWGLVEGVFLDAEQIEASSQFTQLKTMGTKPIAIRAWDDSDPKCWVRFRVLKSQDGDMCALFVAIPEAEGTSDVLSDRLTGFAVSAAQSILDPEKIQKTTTAVSTWIKAVAGLAAALGIGGVSLFQLPIFKGEEQAQPSPTPGSAASPETANNNPLAEYVAELETILRKHGLIRIFTGRVYLSNRQDRRYIRYLISEQVEAPTYEPFTDDITIEPGSYFDNRYRTHRMEECFVTITSEMTDLDAKAIFEESEVVAQLSCGYRQGSVFVGAELDSEVIPDGLEEDLRRLDPPARPL